jgi:hypothetical protein
MLVHSFQQKLDPSLRWDDEQGEARCRGQGTAACATNAVHTRRAAVIRSIASICPIATHAGFAVGAGSKRL